MNLLQELATEARAINASKGWGLTFGGNGDQEIPGYIALIHSEITEAWTAQHPNDARLELGDVIVRALDLGELLRPGVWTELRPEWAFPFHDLRTHGWAADLMDMHTRTSEALECYRKVDAYENALLDKLHLVVTLAWDAIGRYFPGQPPESAVREVLEKNSKRTYRHGGRRT